MFGLLLAALGLSEKSGSPKFTASLEIVGD